MMDIDPDDPIDRDDITQGSDLSGMDLSGVDLTGANLSEAYLSNVDLTGADLIEVNLVSAHLTGADLKDADLSGVDLSNATLTGANLTDASLPDSDLSDADLINTDFSNANLSGADLSDATFTGANFTSADLSEVTVKSKEKRSANVPEKKVDIATTTNAVEVDMSQTGPSQNESAYQKKSEELLSVLQSLHDRLDRIPKSSEIPEECEYSQDDFYAEFESWDEALEAAGIDKEQALINEINRVAGKLGHVPKNSEIGGHGVYSYSTYSSYFDSWNKALEESGFKKGSRRSSEKTREEMLNTLRSLHSQLSRVPKSTELPEEYTPNDFYNKFGSWDEALEAAGINKKQAVLDKIEQLADKIGRVPATSDLDEHGTYPASAYTSYFDSWEDALNQSGVKEGFETKPEKSREEMLNALQSLYERLGRVPKSTELPGQHSLNEFSDEFGSWDEALKTAGIDRKQAILDEIERLAQKLGHIPKTTDIQSHNAYPASAYTSYFDSWDEAIKQSGIDMNESSVGSSDSPDSSESTSEPSSSTQATQSDQLQPSALNSSWETIPEKRRINRQFLIQVINAEQTSRDRMIAQLDICDQNGKEFEMEIWSKHYIDCKWQENGWYALENACGIVWKLGDDTTHKKLRSTPDLSVIELGTDFDPETALNKDGANTDSEQQHTILTTDELAFNSEKVTLPEDSDEIASETGHKNSRVSVPEKANSGDFAELHAFKRDILYVINGLGEAKGLEIKEELDEYYDEEINHGRLYPNLDSLNEAGLVDKFEIDARSNGYKLTATGIKHLEARQKWKAPAVNSSMTDADKLEMFGGSQTRLGIDSDNNQSQPSVRTRLEESDEDTRQEMVSILRSLHSQLGRVPKSTELPDKYSPNDFYTKFGSWDKALAAASFDMEKEILDEIERVADKIESVPTTTEINKHGRYPASAYQSYFDSWDKALNQSGVGASELSDRSVGSSDSAESYSEPPPSQGEIEKLLEIQGVSSSTANRIIKKFGTADKAICASTHELVEIRGVGEPIAARIISNTEKQTDPDQDRSPARANSEASLKNEDIDSVKILDEIAGEFEELLDISR